MTGKRAGRKPSGVTVQSITPFLWFDTEAEEAARFYVSLFRNSRVTSVVPYGRAGPGKPGSTMVVTFELCGRPFIALNGGPMFKFSTAVSFQVSCTTQRQVDRLWSRLGRLGKPGQCGWIEDRFGLTWQVIPTRLGELMSDPNPERAARVTSAMLQMTKIDIGGLEWAARGR